MKHSFSLIELVVAGLIVLLIIGCVAGFWHQEYTVMPRAFSAWEKQTGNESHLTYEEWRDLVRVNKKSNITIIPIYQGK